MAQPAKPNDREVTTGLKDSMIESFRHWFGLSVSVFICGNRISRSGTTDLTLISTNFGTIAPRSVFHFCLYYPLQYLKSKMKGSKEMAEKIVKTDDKQAAKKDPFSVKITNLPFTASKKDVQKLFENGSVTSVRMPRKGFAYVGFKTQKDLRKGLIKNKSFVAIVEFVEASEAKTAFRKLAYSKFKHLPLYLEWAPQCTFEELKTETAEVGKGEEAKEEIDRKPLAPEDDIEIEEDTALFVKNLNFETTDDDLKKVQRRKWPRRLSASAAKKRASRTLEGAKKKKRKTTIWWAWSWATSDSAIQGVHISGGDNKSHRLCVRLWSFWWLGDTSLELLNMNFLMTNVEAKHLRHELTILGFSPTPDELCTFQPLEGSTGEILSVYDSRPLTTVIIAGMQCSSGGFRNGIKCRQPLVKPMVWFAVPRKQQIRTSCVLATRSWFANVTIFPITKTSIFYQLMSSSAIDIRAKNILCAVSPRLSLLGYGYFRDLIEYKKCQPIPLALSIVYSCITITITEAISVWYWITFLLGETPSTYENII
ncbi:unnamed protein product, partial [Nesidiocoris tenuis]